MLKLIIMGAILCFLPSTVFAEKSADQAAKIVVFETSMGNFEIELFDKEAPITAANFRQYAREGFFNNLIFHRVIPGFVIQGGGFEPGMKRRAPTHQPIKNEADNKILNKRGTLSMARTSDINSASSQFFVNVKDNTSLDHQPGNPSQFGYAVFGKVIKGMEVVDKIVAVPTTSVDMHRDVPVTSVVILKAYEK
jgi:cyclophilin family peptidyl-prolyl cis-trans isomerase